MYTDFIGIQTSKKRAESTQCRDRRNLLEDSDFFGRRGRAAAMEVVKFCLVFGSWPVWQAAEKWHSGADFSRQGGRSAFCCV